MTSATAGCSASRSAVTTPFEHPDSKATGNMASTTRTTLASAQPAGHIHGSSRRQFIKAMGLGAAALAMNEAVPATPQPARRPNLVFIFSDQQSWDMLGCYGSSQIITPNIDACAAQGVVFNHCVSSQPVCTPYRGMLLSGLHPLHNGAVTNDIQMLAGNGDYFAEVLRDSGYRLGYFGKWHLYGGDRDRPIPAGPYRYGFDGTFLSNNCTLVYDAEHAYYWDENGERRLYGDWEPYAQARQAMQFIDDNADEPFALFLSWHPPHNWGPRYDYQAPEELMRLYDPDAIELRPNCEDSPVARRVYQGHMAMCTSLDRAFGWIMEQLDRLGLTEDTIVVYTSDHGDTLLSHGWPHNKGRPEQESCRVPLILRYPRRLGPRRSDLLVGSLDLMPTLLRLMSLEPPATCHGRDLAAAMLNQDDAAVESVPLFYFPWDWRGVYTHRHTYAFRVPDGRFPERLREFGLESFDMLYDREADPHEQHNLFGRDEHAATRQHLHEQARAWMERFGDAGMPFHVLMPRILDREAGRGRLRGRPIDLI